MGRVRGDKLEVGGGISNVGNSNLLLADARQVDVGKADLYAILQSDTLYFISKNKE